MIILGGAPRTGKGIISNILMRETGFPYLSIDPVKMALARGVSEYPLNTDGSSINVSTEMWPFLSKLIGNMCETGLNYIIEGEVLPIHANEVAEMEVCNLISCFVGYTEISVQEKVELIKTHSGYPNDWTSNLSDIELIEIVKDGIEYSKYLKRECGELGIMYVDFSNDFEKSVASVVEHIKTEIHNNRLHADVSKLRPKKQATTLIRR